MENSVLLKPWIGPYGGVPPWRMVKPDEFQAAIEKAITEAQDDIQKIADNPAAPTFENTIVAMEQAGRTLDRLTTMFGVHTSNLNIGPIPEIEAAVAPQLSKHQDSIQ